MSDTPCMGCKETPTTRKTEIIYPYMRSRENITVDICDKCYVCRWCGHILRIKKMCPCEAGYD